MTEARLRARVRELEQEVARLRVVRAAEVADLFKKQRVSHLMKVDTEEWTLNAPIYWGAGKATTDSAAGPLIGTAAAPTANPSSYGYVALADPTPRVTLADLETANATDLASAVTLANALKAKLNDLLTALRNGAAT